MEQNRGFSFRRGNVRTELKFHRRGLSLLFDRKSTALGSRVRNIYDQIRVFNVVVMNTNSTFSDSPEKSPGIEHTEEEFEMKSNVGEEIEENGRVSCCSSDFLASETTRHGEQSPSSTENFSISTLSSRWSLKKSPSDCETLEKQSSKFSETEMMKERFSKLLLGEDMSGSGNGVCTALAISNAITNLCATLFGKLWRLEPLAQHKKEMWRREMDWLLCVSDHIVEMTPTWQTFSDGSKLEIMTCKPRSDLDANLPALRKLDNMLLEILDSFEETEFWYVDQGIETPDSPQNRSKTLQRQEDKWWLPVPRVSPGGLQENTRKQLQYKRDCTNQILKAAIAINNITISDMEVPESYLESLPKNGRSCLGDMIYKYISSEQFSPESLLDCLDLSSEHNAIEIANRVESSIHLWRKRINTTTSWSTNSWEMVKELMVDTEKQELMADRAQTLLHSLKLRFPGLRQTVLDMSKIQFNKDIGKSILESYSRVLESLAFNIVARIDDLMFVDDLTRQECDQVSAKFEFCSPVKPVLTDSVEKTEERLKIQCSRSVRSTVSEFCSPVKPVLTDSVAKIEGRVKDEWLKPVRSTLSRSSLEQCMKDSLNIQNLESGELKI